MIHSYTKKINCHFRYIKTGNKSINENKKIIFIKFRTVAILQQKKVLNKESEGFQAPENFFYWEMGNRWSLSKHSITCTFFFLLMYGLFTMFLQFLLYSKVTQLHTVPCAVEYTTPLPIHSKSNGLHPPAPNSPSIPLPSTSP